MTDFVCLVIFWLVSVKARGSYLFVLYRFIYIKSVPSSMREYAICGCGREFYIQRTKSFKTGIEGQM